MSKFLIATIVSAQFALAVLRKRLIYESNQKYAAVLLASVFGHGVLLQMGGLYASISSFLMSMCGARMVVVGVTGQAGAGKKTVLEMLKSNHKFQGISAIDARRRVLRPKQLGFYHVKFMFGKNFLTKGNDGAEKIDVERLKEVMQTPGPARTQLHLIMQMHTELEVLRQIFYSRVVLWRNHVAVLDAALFDSWILWMVCNPVLYVQMSRDDQRIRRLYFFQFSSVFKFC